MTKIEDIVKKEFSRSFMGYDMREVDYFLDEIIEQMETYERERQEMLTAMEYLLRELEQFDDIADEAEKQLHDVDGGQAAASDASRARRRATRVHPVVPPADPAEEPPETAAADEPIVLEEFEVYAAAPAEEAVRENGSDAPEEPDAPDEPDAPPEAGATDTPDASEQRKCEETAVERETAVADDDARSKGEEPTDCEETNAN